MTDCAFRFSTWLHLVWLLRIYTYPNIHNYTDTSYAMCALLLPAG